MSILNVNTIQPVGSAQTVTVNATDFKIGSTTLNSSGLVNASAGSTSAPSISPVGDSNTGIFFPASDTVAIGEGGTEVIRVDSSGRVGVGTNRMTRPFEVWAGTAGTSFSVDTVGRVQMPFQPAFYAYQSSAAQRTTTGAFTTEFDTTILNVGSHYSTSTGRFTAPVTGVYMFQLKGLIRRSSADGAVELPFYKNGNNVVSRSFTYSAMLSTANHETVTAILYISLVPNDYIQMGIYSISAGCDVYYGQNLASFCGHLVG